MTSKQVKILQLNKLSNDAKEKIYNKLLSGEYQCELTAYKDNNINDRYILDIKFEHNDNCVSSWGLNFYTRTDKAVKNQRYKSLGYALSANKKLFNNLRLTPCSNLRVYYKSTYRGTHLFNIEY